MIEQPSPQWANYSDFSDNLEQFEEFYKELEAQYKYLALHFTDFFITEETKKGSFLQVLKADQILNRYSRVTLEIFEKQVRSTKELKELLHNQRIQSEARKEEIQRSNEFLSVHEVRRFDLG